METKVFGQDRVFGFLHADGQRMLNGRGEEVVLRGLGAANWNNPEGFMIGGFSDFAVPEKKVNTPIGRMDRGRSFSALIRELCGSRYEKEFWPQWFRNHLSEADICQMARWGFNSIRLPLDARTLLYEEPGIEFNEDTFAMLDDVLTWCEQYHMYAVLDLHAAVGGQSALPCDDGVDGMPHLFYDEESWERTMILCEELAKRYGSRTIVGAWDLINEPLSGPLWEEYIPKLKSFYHELVERMRVYDKNHLMLLNGHIFSSRVDMFDEDYDPQCHNWGLAIHNYGAMPDMAMYGAALERSRALNVPVWYGEGGGSPQWMTAVYELAAEHHIGFNIWCYKAAGAGDTSHWFVTHKLPKEWPMIISYARDGGVRPSYAHAQEIFNEYLELIKYENCCKNDSIVPYVMRTPGCEVPAVAYDDVCVDKTAAAKAAADVYSDVSAAKVCDGADIEGSTVAVDGIERPFYGKNIYGNALNCRAGDGLHIVTEEGYVSKIGMIGPQDVAGDWEHYVLELSAGEYVTYTLRECTKDCTITVVLERCDGAFVEINVGGKTVYGGNRAEDRALMHTDDGEAIHIDDEEAAAGMKAASFDISLKIRPEMDCDTLALRIAVTSGRVIMKKLIYEKI